MNVGKYYNVYFEHTEAERHLKLLSLPPQYTSDQYDGFLFEQDDGAKLLIREFSKIVSVAE